MTLGRATYEPGLAVVGPRGRGDQRDELPGGARGARASGQAAVRMDDGSEQIMREGDFFYVPPGHDSWVVGDEPYVSLHVVGSEGYAA